jgi:hypothetical protein
MKGDRLLVSLALRIVLVLNFLLVNLVARLAFEDGKAIPLVAALRFLIIEFEVGKW